LAATLGRLDGSVGREQALAHAAQVAGAVEVPVAADTENAYADSPEGVAETVTLACATGLAGCSVEDYSRSAAGIHDLGLATDRVAAAAEAAHRGPVHLVLTARAENYLYGRPDLPGTIARLQRYQEAGADVLFAPGVVSLADIRTVVSSVDRPVNVLALAGRPPVEELKAAGVARVSVGGAFAFAALAGMVEAARELRDRGT
jgi:2-methylisocitrate lyase-like PEP mutase family enzyme